ncbi:MAG: hypothetical protein ABI288_07445 [Ginsengibacter sp.]
MFVYYYWGNESFGLDFFGEEVFVKTFTGKIGAGAGIIKFVPDFVIVPGNPRKVIKSKKDEGL